MDVLVGSSSAATASCLFLNQNGVVGSGGGGGLNQNGVVGSASDSFSSSSSSSIGAPDDSDDDEDNESKQGSGDVTDSEEVESKLTSLNSLEDALPIKRGLSNHFSGKSKSFASLSDVVTSATTVKELEKRDNPLNKRRRVQIATKWYRKSSSTSSSSFYNHPNTKSMPLLASLDEDEEETQEDPTSEQSSSDEKVMRSANPKLLDRGMKSFKSRSSYCLSDLEEQH